MNLCALNKIHLIEGWPIPNIELLLRNIGRQKPKYFGIMDLTQGYYQGTMAKSCREYIAFITQRGLYEWLRVPMGLIATVVLVGLIHVICESYINDVFVFAQSEDEFISRLELVFARFENKTLH